MNLPDVRTFIPTLLLSSFPGSHSQLDWTRQVELNTWGLYPALWTKPTLSSAPQAMVISEYLCGHTPHCPDHVRDPHIIIFFSSYYSILKFVFWLPVILWIFSHYSNYSPWLGYIRSIEGLARDSVDVELTIYYRIYTGRKELENEDDRAEKADWRQSQTLLTRCNWRRWMWTLMMPSSQSAWS